MTTLLLFSLRLLHCVLTDITTAVDVVFGGGGVASDTAFVDAADIFIVVIFLAAGTQ